MILSNTLTAMLRGPDRRLFLAVAIMFVVLPGFIQAGTLVSAYIDEAALVFSPATANVIDYHTTKQQPGQLPPSILVPGLPLIFSSEVRQACRSVYAKRNDLLVYVPQTKVCLTLTTLFRQATEVHPDQFNYGFLERERQTLIRGLESESYLFMQPISLSLAGGSLNGTVTAGMCSCPNPPEQIFKNGFEDLF